jgi:hypothetical protein
VDSLVSPTARPLSGRENEHWDVILPSRNTAAAGLAEMFSPRDGRHKGLATGE